MSVAAMRARHEPVASVETITPEQAYEMLSRNVVNRNVRMGKVQQYARDLLASRFVLTGEAIKFDTNGNLIDGQHRLHAVIRSGTPLVSFVVRGVEPEAQLVLDSGASRNTGDALHFQGVRNAGLVASSARLALAWTLADDPVRAGALRGASFSTGEVVEFVDANPSIVEAARYADTIRKGAVRLTGAPLGASIWALSRVNPSDCERFFDGIALSSLDGPSDPRLTLVRRVTSARQSRQQLSAATQFGLILRTWNAWRSGTRLTALATHRNIDGVPVEVIIPRPR